jgi:HK97 family phage portal protein
MWNPFKRKEKLDLMTMEKASRAMPAIISATGEQPRTVSLRVNEFQNVYGDSDYASVWVFACVKSIAQTFAALNLKFYRTVKRRGKERKKDELIPLEENHPLVSLFWNLNPIQTRYDFWEASLISLELTGELFWALEDLVGQKPREIWVLRPDRMQVVPDKQDMIAGYKFVVGGHEVLYRKDEIIFGKYHSPTNDFRGMSPLNAARQGIISEYYTTKANQNVFKQGMRVSGAFVTGKALNDTGFKRLRAQLNEMYAGVDNFHRNLLLEQGLDFKQMSITAKDMEFIQQRKLNREEILGVFKVPPSKVGIFEYANYANSKEQDKIYWTECILPRTFKIQEYINVFLCPRYGEDIHCEFDLTKVEAFRQNDELKSKITDRLTKSGIMTINEVRDKFYNMESVAWGDTWNAPFNLMPIDSSRSNNSGKEVDEGNLELKETRELAESILKQQSTTVQSVIFSKSEGWTKVSAKKWAKDHGFKTGVDETGTSYRMRQREPSEFIEGSMRTIILQDKPKKIVKAVIGKLKKSLELPESERNEKIWNDFVKFLTPREKKVESVMVEFFGEQEGRVLGKFDDLTKSVKQELFDPKVMARLIYDDEGERLLLERGMRKTMLNVVEQAGSRAAAGLGARFDVANPRVIEFMGNKLFKFSNDVSRTTSKHIRESLIKGVEAGESLTDIRNRIRQDFTYAENVRAARIARTEVVGASNGAAHEAYRQVGVEGEEWISSRDGNVRETHVQAELDYSEEMGGTPKPLQESFILSDGDVLRYPGDSIGKAENVVDCRCTTAPVIKTE